MRRLRAKVSDIPTNFSWVYRGKVAASGIPSSREQVEWLARHGVNSVLTLTEAPLPAEWFEGMNIRVRHLPMKDHEVPPVEALDEAASYIDQEVKSGRTVLVHCLAGKGRTGSALAAYLMKTKGMSAKEASEPLITLELRRPDSDIISDLRERFPGAREIALKLSPSRCSGRAYDGERLIAWLMQWPAEHAAKERAE